MSDWFKRKYDWVEMVMAEPTLRGLPAAVTFMLARHYLNAETQDAWPSVETLAERLNCNPRNVRRALARLVAAGKLEFVRGGHGRGDSNRYRMANTLVGEVRTTLAQGAKATKKGGAEGKKGWRRRQKRVAQKVKKGWRTRHPSTVGEYEREGEREFAPLRGDPLCPPSFDLSPELPQDRDGSDTATQRVGNPGQTRHQPRRAGKPFPDGWVLDNTELATAHLVAGWDLPKAEQEFDKLRDRAADQGWQSSNWAAAWKTWCVRGRDYEAKHPQKAGVFDYGREWMAGQKPTEH